MNIVIMAGGGGTRLWPLSRSNRPKQFLDLGSGKTLLEHTYERAGRLTAASNIYIATTQPYLEQVKKLLPGVPDERLFLEPEKRDTAAAFAAVAVQLQQRGQDGEPTIFMWSDHVFTAEETFVADLQKIPRLVAEHPDTVIIVGHKPTFPETGFGYVEVGEPVAGENNVFQVKAFKEKPDRTTAEQYVLAGNYYWNMAYISLRPAYLLQELERHEPALMKGIKQFAEALARHPEEAKAIYAALPKIAIDYALLERTPRLLMVAGDYGWSDIGNWAAVHEIFGQQGDHMPRGHHIHVDSQNNFVYNDTAKVVSMIGMQDTIVVITDDAILVTTKKDAHKVKEVVARLEQDKKTQHL
jgi:mannose-1-phosphate guanylyltransferase